MRTGERDQIVKSDKIMHVLKASQADEWQVFTIVYHIQTIYMYVSTCMHAHQYMLEGT